jgi:hypothetical protein
MAVADNTEMPLRWKQAESSRLAWALLLSLVLHLAAFGTYEAGVKFGWWRYLSTRPFMQSARMLTDLIRLPPKPQPLRPEAIPLVFVEVNPVVATPEPPKDAKFYSDKNSKAANPEADKETDVPRISGKQEQVPKTEDVPRQKQPEKFVPLQPSKPPEVAREEKPKPPEKPGDLALGKPETRPPTETTEPPRTRPRTIQEALARKQMNRIPGEAMKQDGGVKRRLEISSLDTKATPFGAYDAALVEAISKRWFALLDQRDYASDSRGKVVLNFRLFFDGSVKDMTVAENSTASEVLGLLCRKAVEDPAPFPAWPSDMRRMLGETRSIQFTFYYN